MITSRKAGDLAEAVAGLVAGGAAEDQVAWVAAHVGKPEDAPSCVAETVARFGGLDILVNNAGTNPYFGPMIDIDVARAQKTFEVNQLSVLLWTGAAVKAGLRGSVINVASIGGLGVEPGIGWYNVTKAAVLHITRQLSYELAPDVRVNALAPGLVKTKLAAALWEGRARSGSPRTSRCAGSACPTTSPPRRSSWPPTPRRGSRVRRWSSTVGRRRSPRAAWAEDATACRGGTGARRCARRTYPLRAPNIRRIARSVSPYTTAATRCQLVPLSSASATRRVGNGRNDTKSKKNRFSRRKIRSTRSSVSVRP